MKLLVFSVFCLYLIAGSTCLAQAQTLKKVNQLEQSGQFREATSLLKAALKSNPLPAIERKQLEFELDRLTRIKKDFPYSRDALFSELKKAVKDLTRAEYDRWV